MKDRRPQLSCNKNRAEELGPDVWDYFVVPHFFDQLDIREATKPRVIEGGRGSGKTMLLRYFSYQSVFSSRRSVFGPDDLKYIGLYWKADTQFARQMTGRSIADADWLSAFQHHLAIVISLEIVKAVKAVALSKHPAYDQAAMTALDFSALAAFCPDIPKGCAELQRYLVASSRTFETWLNNPHTMARPVFLPGRTFALALIEELKAQADVFQDTVFSLFLDEYENLTKQQQRIVNTHIKHCELPLLVHVAMKKGSLSDRGTLGDEYIVEVSDYRSWDLDQLLHESQFELFAAEILFSRFALAGVQDLVVDLTTLKDPGRLASRKTPEYARCVRLAAERLLPGLSEKQLAAKIWGEPGLRRRVETDIATALKNTSFSPASFWDDTTPEAILVAASLLNRESLKPNEVIEELQLLRSGKENKFTGGTNWIHNNLVGSILRLYGGTQRPCLIYSGFSTFITLAHGNLRHFLELCDRCLSQASDEQLVSGIPIEVQAEAARQASAAFLTEIRNFGPLGYALRNFVLSLGSLFALAHARPSQSEPEINHFSLKGGSAPAKEDSEMFREAIKWSVLFEERETKVKSEGADVIDADWVLNPIYAPYFKISYRKRRKLTLTVEEFRVMALGEFDARRDLMGKYRRGWALEAESDSLPLFAYLTETA